MRSLWLSLALAAASCASIPIAPKGTVPPAPKEGREVPVCLLVGERFDRPEWLGVNVLSLATWDSVIGTLVVKHPEHGLVLIDPAFSHTIGEDLAKAPLYSKLVLGDGRTKTPLHVLMRKVGLEPTEVTHALVSHAHWDHMGAVGEVPLAKILLPRAEHDWLPTLEGQGSMPSGVMLHLVKRAASRLEAYDFEGPPLLGFPSSHDVFGDGSIVAVPMPGHTPGSVGFFIRGEGGKRWLYSGDATWTLKGVQAPAHRQPLVRPLLDSDVDTLSVTIGRLHAVLEDRPEVQVVPAHDYRAYVGLPECVAP